MLYSHEQLYICMQKHIQHNKNERTQFLRKIYLSHFIRERVDIGYVWEVSWRPNRIATYWPPLFWLSPPFFPVLLGCSTRGLGTQPMLGHGSHSSIFSPTDLNFLSPGLYNNLMPTYFLRASHFRTQFNPSTVKVAPDLISSTWCTCYLHRCISYFDSFARSEVNRQQ